MDNKDIIKDFYNSTVDAEWMRIANRPEYFITVSYLDRYIKPGDKVLDIGGGPGRYSLYLAQKGCDVTLFDLAEQNLKFASEKATGLGVNLKAVCGDACKADSLVSGEFDHVLLMGPMYHLLDEESRVTAVNAALALLKTDGLLFVSFINMFSGIIYAMKCMPDIISEPTEKVFYDTFIDNKSFSGDAFTRAHFSKQQEILPFMSRFPLEKLHFLGQESITSPCESNIMSQPKEIVDMWLKFAIEICEREELLSWSEHLMYIGRKTAVAPEKKLVVILGPHAVGKMTVGQELVKLTGLTLFHNHLSIEFVRQFFGTLKNPEAKYLNSHIREEVFKCIANSELKGMIFTMLFAFDLPSEYDYINNLITLFREYGAKCCVVELCADFDVRIERNKSENRLANKESKRNTEHSEAEMRSTSEKYRLNSNSDDVIPFENYIKIDNTELPPEEVARMIKEHFGL